MKVLPITADRVSARDVARECLAEAGSQREAVEMLVARMSVDAALRSEVMTPWEPRAAEALVRAVQTKSRAALWLRPVAPDDRIAALRNAAQTMLMDFPLPGGKRLGDATAEDLLAAGGFYSRQAGDMAHKARWLGAVRDRMGDAATVASALDEAALRALQGDTANA